MILDTVGPYIDVLLRHVKPGALFGCVDALVARDTASRWWHVDN